MNNKILGMALVAGSMALSTGAQAAFLIDDFSNSSPFTPAPGEITTTPLPGSDFSNTRVLKIDENPEGAGGASAIVDSGKLAISTGFATGADTTSTYKNASGFDFTVAESGGAIFDAFVLELLTIDQGGVDVTLTVDGISSSQFINTPNSPLVFAHSLFGDVSDVKDIQIFIHNNVEVDASFDSFGSFGNQASSVPEPTTLALLGMGLAAFGFGRRKAK